MHRREHILDNLERLRQAIGSRGFYAKIRHLNNEESLVIGASIEISENEIEVVKNYHLITQQHGTWKIDAPECGVEKERNSKFSSSDIDKVINKACEFLSSKIDNHNA